MSKTRTILFAEADTGYALLFLHALRKERVRHNLKWFTNGEDLFAYIEGKGPYTDRQEHPPPDLLVVDTNVPAMNGFSVLETVRSSPVSKELPVVVLCNPDDGQEKKTAVRQGATAVYVRPGVVTELQHILHQVIESLPFSAS